MKKKLLAMALFLLPMVASASHIETVIGNLNYLVNTDEKTAVVDKSMNASGDIVIPETIEYENETYTIVGLQNQYKKQ
jgi:phosphoenolpyruvate carboxylase